MCIRDRREGEKMLTIIKPFHAAAAEKRMDQVLAQAIEGIETECLETAEELMHTELAGKRLLFAVGLSATGILSLIHIWPTIFFRVTVTTIIAKICDKSWEFQVMILSLMIICQLCFWII